MPIYAAASLRATWLPLSARVCLSALGCPASKVGLQMGDLHNPCDQMHFWSLHAGGANFLKGDGSVRMYHYGANTVLPQMCTRSGMEPYIDP